MPDMTFAAYEQEGFISDVGLKLGDLVLRTGQRLVWMGGTEREQVYRKLRNLIVELEGQGYQLTNRPYMLQILGKDLGEAADVT